MTAAERYRQAAQLAGADPIEAGLIGNLADHECIHGRLPADGSRRCGCWAEEGAVLALVDQRLLSPQIAREIRGLCRAGLSVGAIVVVVDRYFNVKLTYAQVKYHLVKAGVTRPRVSKGKVVA